MDDNMQKILDGKINDEGVIAGVDYQAGDYGDIGAGAVLFEAYRQTQNEKYKKAAQRLMELLSKKNRDENNIFAIDCTDTKEAAKLYTAMVFYIKYETVFGGKEHYNDAVTMCKAIYRHIYPLHKDYETMILYLASLIEALESIEQSIYEYYDDLKQLYKAVLKDILAADAFQAEAAKKQINETLQFAVKEGCRVKAVLEEKYGYIYQ